MRAQLTNCWRVAWWLLVSPGQCSSLQGSRVFWFCSWWFVGFSQPFVMQPCLGNPVCPPLVLFLLLIKRFPWVIDNLPTASFRHRGGQC